MLSKASSEIAQSRERFEKWWAESRELNPDCGCEKRGTRWFKCSYHEGADDAWEQAERDTRERCAQLARKSIDTALAAASVTILSYEEVLDIAARTILGELP